MRAILTYHSIDPSGSPISLDRETFARHVAFLSSGRVRVLALDELLAAPESPDALALTFDDGFANFATDAWPRLRDAKLPATLFVPTQRVGGDNRWKHRDEPGIPTLPLLGWDELAKLASEGLVLGAHSRSHAHLDRVSAQQLHDEVEGAFRDLADRVAAPPRAFCYPYGDFNELVERAVAERYPFACTTEHDALGPAPAPHRLPRLDAYYFQAPGTLEAFGAAPFRSRVFLRRQARKLRRWIAR
jgi:peptidoglycan/xylan/chitin deacetylase (PgdA/CDA1 family)